MTDKTFKTQPEDGLTWWSLTTYKRNDELAEWYNAVREFFNCSIFGVPRIFKGHDEDGLKSILYRTDPCVLEAVLDQTNLVIQHEIKGIYFLSGSIDYSKPLKIYNIRTDYNKMYWEFEKMYNPYPVQMARFDAFRHALEDNLINEKTYEEARTYFGKLWHYVGD